MPRLRRSLAIVLGICIAGLTAEPAAADPHGPWCTYDAAAHKLDVTVNAGGAWINRDGSAIEVHGCTTEATVTNTDTIEVTGPFSLLTISLASGPLAPGFSPEADGSPEIEIAVNRTAGDAPATLRFMGSTGADKLRAGTSDGVDAFNLNAGEATGDADLRATGATLVWVYADGGADVVDGRGGAGTGGPLATRLLVHGRPGDDTLAAGDGGADLYGQAGNDTLIGGAGDDSFYSAAGNDKITGGDGFDSLDFRYDGPNPTHGARLDLAKTGPQDTYFGLDTIGGIERVNGTWYADELRGTGDQETLDGYNGHDVLDGRGGADVIQGGEGADTLLTGSTARGTADGADEVDGGNGSDTVSYAGRLYRVAITLDGVRNDGADPNRDGVSSAAEEGDLLTGIENATGGSAADLLVARVAGVNVLTGGPGGDFLDAFDGGSAVDRLLCGDGSDTYRADAGDQRDACETAAP